MNENSSQLEERDDEILIAIVDETYGVTNDEIWAQERERYRQALEADFGISFSDADIGPGASLPAFVTLLQGTAMVPVWLLASAAFFLGKPLHENLMAWRDMAVKVRSFFKRPVFLNRQGAAILAIEAVFDKMGGIPKTVRLVGYQTVHVSEDESNIQSPEEIADAVPTLFLGFVRHVFEIEADGIIFRVIVDGRRVDAVRLN